MRWRRGDVHFRPVLTPRMRSSGYRLGLVPDSKAPPSHSEEPGSLGRGFRGVAKEEVEKAERAGSATLR